MNKVDDTITSINAIIGEKNVFSYYFPRRVEKLHTRSANVQCFNPIVYKQHLYKTKEICRKYVTFTPHLRSLEGTSSLTKDELEQFGLNDINRILVGTIEAIQNALQPQGKNLTHGEMKEIVEQAMRKRKSTAQGRDTEGSNKTQNRHC